VNNESDLSAFSTSIPLTQEPLTLERMMRTFQALRDEWSEPPVKILSPTEYFRRTGFRLPLSDETLAELAQPTPLLDRHKQELIYGTSFMHIKDFHLPPYRTPEGTPSALLTTQSSGSLTSEDILATLETLPDNFLTADLERFYTLVEELKAHASPPNWIISPKTQHQLLRLTARARRNHRAWLRAKRQRRARQRRHNRGQ